MQCKKCNSLNLKIIKSGPHNKLICGDCLAFQKFVSKKDKKTFEELTKDTPKNEDDKYSKLIKDLLINTKKLNG